MTTRDDLIDQLRRAGAPDSPVEVDCLAGRGVAAALNPRGIVVLSAVRADDADSDDLFAPPSTVEELAELVDEAHRRLHEDDVRAAHAALHAARTGYYTAIRPALRARAREG